MPYVNKDITKRLIIAGTKAFGLKRGVSVSLFYPLLNAIQMSMSLDKIFYPKYQDVNIKNPIFILGHPRSGTTFFHRLLTQFGDYPVFPLWQIFMPSLTVRKVISPFIDTLASFFRKDFKQEDLFPDGEHETGPFAIEEEELLFALMLETQLEVFLTTLAFADEDFKDLVFCDHWPKWRREKTMNFFHECLKRQIYATGKTQILAKMPCSTFRVKSILEQFPDAKIIYLVRSPYNTIPSHLSLHRTYFKNRWGLENIPPERLAMYYQRRYRHNVELYQYFHDVYKNNEIPHNQVKIIMYDDFLSNLSSAFNDLVEFTGITVTKELSDYVLAQAEKNKNYKPKHKNLDLHDFGISKDKILKDLEFIFDEFGFDKELETLESYDNCKKKPKTVVA